MPEVEAECMDCKTKRWIKAGEVQPGDMPECKECLGLMIATGKAKG